MAANDEYDVREPLNHDGDRYEPGDTVVGLTDQQAQPLLDAVPPVIAVRTSQEDTAPKADPQDPETRHSHLKAFMAELEVPEDPRGSDFWTNGGKPEVAALADALGWTSVSAKERDAAWNEVLAERQKPSGDS